jgi:hypothetical protein
MTCVCSRTSRVLFCRQTFDLKRLMVDWRVPIRFFSLISGRKQGGRLVDRRPGFGADRTVQWVGHEQQTLGLGLIALGVPDRELVGRQ